jgi:hypothetical protein
MLLATLGVLGLATPAWAHAKLRSSTPAAGATLAAAPTDVALTFNEDVTLGAGAAPITVTGPDGTSWEIGQATLAGSTVSAPVTPTGPAGEYTLKWTVVSDDGDPVSGTVVFTLSVPATPPAAEPAPAGPAPAAQPVGAPRPAGDGGVPSWVWILLGVVVLAGAAVGVAVRNSRGRTR